MQGGAVSEQSKTTSVDTGSSGKALFPTSQCLKFPSEHKTHGFFMTCYICAIVFCSVLPAIKLPGSTFPSWSSHSSIYIHLHRIYDICIFDIVHDVCIYTNRHRLGPELI